jgi:hypothetical protein
MAKEEVTGFTFNCPRLPDSPEVGVGKGYGNPEHVRVVRAGEESDRVVDHRPDAQGRMHINICSWITTPLISWGGGRMTDGETTALTTGGAHE